MRAGITNGMLPCASDTSLYADIPSTAARLKVPDNLTIDLMIVQSWYARWGMILNLPSPRTR